MADLLTIDWFGWLSMLILGAGVFFFVAGTIGLLRFPDVFCRLHALTKADTLGLGLVVIGLSMRADSVQTVGVMVLIWLLVMASGATACQLLARFERERELISEPLPGEAPQTGSPHVDN